MEFAMEQGCLGILGASGCGKSMTLKAVAGIVTPDRGKICTEKQVFLDTERKIDLAPQKRRVGYLFQNYALFPNMTVAENIAAGIRGGAGRRRVPKEQIRKQTAELLDRFHLGGLGDTYPGRLSGGQQQRTAIARILASNPDILLLDEPFSAMDSYLREELQIELKNHLKQFDGCTIIVSHDRDEVYKLCETTMIMGEGKNITLGPTEQIFADPVYQTAARLTGCKNISKIEKLGPHLLRALDWGVELQTEKEITNKITYIGIRAHDFKPLWGEAGNAKNVIETEPCDVTKAPFEWTLRFRNRKDPGNAMWMKQNGGSIQIPEKVRVDPGKILLLEE